MDGVTWLATAVGILAITVPLAATIHKSKYSNGKLDVDTFAEFRDEVRGDLRSVSNNVEALRALIISRLK